jgi:AraC-like DNA-binding protein
MQPGPFELRTKDLDRVNHLVSGVVGPFGFDALTGPYDARVRHDRLGPVSLTSVAYGNPVEITGVITTDRFILHWPVTGHLDVRTSRTEFQASRGTAHLIRPGSPVRLRGSRDCRFLIMSMEASDLAAEARSLAGEDVRLPAVMPEALPLTGAASPVARFMEHLYVESRSADGLLQSAAAARAAGQTLIASVLSALGVGAHAPRPAQPGYMKRAEEFIVANLTKPIGLADVVANAEVSMRTLYSGFQARHRVGPITWLRRQRLERVHAELVAANTGETSVSAVALRWGFEHLGRFAAQYRAHYGQSPSQTLRQR